MANVRPGDRICSACNSLVYSSQTFCRCGSNKAQSIYDHQQSESHDDARSTFRYPNSTSTSAVLVPQSASSRSIISNSVTAIPSRADWMCSSCHNNISAHNESCKCGGLRPGIAAVDWHPISMSSEQSVGDVSLDQLFKSSALYLAYSLGSSSFTHGIDWTAPLERATTDSSVPAIGSVRKKSRWDSQTRTTLVSDVTNNC